MSLVVHQLFNLLHNNTFGFNSKNIITVFQIEIDFGIRKVIQKQLLYLFGTASLCNISLENLNSHEILLNLTFRKFLHFLQSQWKGLAEITFKIFISIQVYFQMCLIAFTGKCILFLRARPSFGLLIQWLFYTIF